MTDLSDDQFDKLENFIELCEMEAETCAEAGAYYGACVLYGAALEGMLLRMCDLFPKDVEAGMALLPKKKRPNGELVTWLLAPLIGVARAGKWLPEKRVDGSDWVDSLKDLRNSIHPGKHIASGSNTIGGAEYLWAKEAYEAAYDWVHETLAVWLSRVATMDEP